MKTTITITIDTEVLFGIKERKENISGTINRLLKEYLNIKEDMSKIKKEKIIDDLNKKKIEIIKIEERLSNLNKDEERKKKEDIEKYGVPFKFPNQR